MDENGFGLIRELFRFVLVQRAKTASVVVNVKEKPRSMVVKDREWRRFCSADIEGLDDIVACSGYSWVYDTCGNIQRFFYTCDNMQRFFNTFDNMQRFFDTSRLPQRERREMQKEILSLLGLHRRPKGASL